MQALFAAVRGQKRIRVPGVIEIPRPDHVAKQRRNVVTDPAELRRWFNSR